MGLRRWVLMRGWAVAHVAGAKAALCGAEAAGMLASIETPGLNCARSGSRIRGPRVPRLPDPSPHPGSAGCPARAPRGGLRETQLEEEDVATARERHSPHSNPGLRSGALLCSFTVLAGRDRHDAHHTTDRSR